MKKNKILFCSYSGSNNNTCICARDVNTGVVAMTYRGDSCSDMVVVSGSYIIAADEARPKIIIWLINKKDPIHTIACPARPRCLTASNMFIVAGILNSFYIWMVSSGSLLRVVEYHLQTITAIQLKDNQLLVTADQGGNVAVWSLQALLQKPLNNEPIRASNYHNNSITDVTISRLAYDDFIVASASADCTVRVWKGRGMEQTHILEYPIAPSSIQLNNNQLIIALHDASLRVSSLHDTSIPATVMPYKSPITKILLYGEGMLVVGMVNGEVAVSHINQPPHKTFKQPGKITSLLVAELEEGWSEVAWRPSTPLSPLTMHTSSNDSMTLVVKGYISSRDEEVDEKMTRKSVVEVTVNQKSLVALDKRKEAARIYLEKLLETD